MNCPSTLSLLVTSLGCLVEHVGYHHAKFQVPAAYSACMLAIPQKLRNCVSLYFSFEMETKHKNWVFMFDRVKLSVLPFVLIRLFFQPTSRD